MTLLCSNTASGRCPRGHLNVPAPFARAIRAIRSEGPGHAWLRAREKAAFTVQRHPVFSPIRPALCQHEWRRRRREIIEAPPPHDPYAWINELRRLRGKWGCFPHAPQDVARRMRKLKNSYAGQHAFVMGNGPSLNQMDLERFSNEIVFGANRCWLLYDRISWRPAFHAACDVRVVPDIADEFNAQIAGSPNTTFFFPIEFREQRILHDLPNITWYWNTAYLQGASSEELFSLDAARQVVEGRTVTVANLQLAAYLGFNPIYLIGCDTNYVIHETVTVHEGDSRALTSQQDDDPNHFDPRYFGKGRKWHDPSVHLMLEHYGHAKKVCDAAGIQVFNATVGGMLEIFPRVDYRSVSGK